jgi:hypothetical protein
MPKNKVDEKKENEEEDKSDSLKSESKHEEEKIEIGGDENKTFGNSKKSSEEKDSKVSLNENFDEN